MIYPDGLLRQDHVRPSLVLPLAYFMVSHATLQAISTFQSFVAAFSSKIITCASQAYFMAFTRYPITWHSMC